MFENMRPPEDSKEESTDKKTDGNEEIAAAQNPSQRHRFYTPAAIDADVVQLSEKWTGIQHQEKFAANARPLERHIHSTAFNSSSKPDNMTEKDYAKTVLEKEKEKSPESIREIEEAKKRLLDFTDSIGVKRTVKSFPDNEDIYIRNTIANTYKPSARNFTITGTCYPNEIEVLGDDMPAAESGLTTKKGMPLIMQHELVHSLCINKNYVEAFWRREIGDGFGTRGKETFHAFNEGMTEITNLQAFLENGLNPAETSYMNQVLFVSMLVEDITRRLNRTARIISFGRETEDTQLVREVIELCKNIQGHDNPKELFSTREILSYFQKGMFDSHRGCLKLISHIYGKEALLALSIMGFEKMEVIECAQAFKLDGFGEAMAAQIESYNSGEMAMLDIGGHKIGNKIGLRADNS